MELRGFNYIVNGISEPVKCEINHDKLHTHRINIEGYKTHITHVAKQLFYEGNLELANSLYQLLLQWEQAISRHRIEEAKRLVKSWRG